MASFGKKIGEKKGKEERRKITLKKGKKVLKMIFLGYKLKKFRRRAGWVQYICNCIYFGAPVHLSRKVLIRESKKTIFTIQV